MIEFKTTLQTDGGGYWSEVSKDVRILGFDISATQYRDTDPLIGRGPMVKFGELRVIFDTADWDIDADGLIYTDKGFKEELHAFFKSQGVEAKASYSEQGMQGSNYVSMDVCETFITEFDLAFEHKTFYSTCGE
jgi:hypothetical protein